MKFELEQESVFVLVIALAIAGVACRIAGCVTEKASIEMGKPQFEQTSKS